MSREKLIFHIQRIVFTPLFDACVMTGPTNEHKNVPEFSCFVSRVEAETVEKLTAIGHARGKFLSFREVTAAGVDSRSLILLKQILDVVTKPQWKYVACSYTKEKARTG